MRKADDIANRFHEVYEALAPSFDSNGHDEHRKLIQAVVRIVLPELPEDAPPQQITIERNRWQSKVGVLLTLISTMGTDELREAAIRAVNTNPYTGSIDDPYADIATIRIADTLRTAVDAQLVVPGPNAPSCLR